jgi:hypothetical protein
MRMKRGETTCGNSSKSIGIGAADTMPSPGFVQGPRSGVFALVNKTVANAAAMHIWDVGMLLNPLPCLIAMSHDIML